MRFLLLISVVTLLFSCSIIKKEKNTNVTLTNQNPNNKDVEVLLTDYKDKNFLCISLVNNTNRKIYIPHISFLVGGLKVFTQGFDNKYIYYTDEFITLGIEHFTVCDYEDVKKYCKPTHSDFLNHKEIDSLARTIIKYSSNKHPRLYNKVFELLEDLVMIEPGQSYNDYFPISDSIKFNAMLIYYSYPYPYPVIRTLPHVVSDEQLEYNRKVLDSLKFDYPKYIKGYELYDKPIVSDTLFINE